MSAAAVKTKLWLEAMKSAAKLRRAIGKPGVYIDGLGAHPEKSTLLSLARGRVLAARQIREAA